MTPLTLNPPSPPVLHTAVPNSQIKGSFISLFLQQRPIFSPWVHSVTRRPHWKGTNGIDGHQRLNFILLFLGGMYMRHVWVTAMVMVCVCVWGWICMA